MILHFLHFFVILLQYLGNSIIYFHHVILVLEFWRNSYPKFNNYSWGGFVLKKILKQIGLIALTGCVVMACAKIGKIDERWSDYSGWTRLTKNNVITGDLTGTLGGVHEGLKGYREVYINDVGLAVSQGDAPYRYPIGTVLVKEQYKDKAAWETKKTPSLTIMVKVSDIDEEEEENWRFSTGLNKKAAKNTFCFDCHAAVLGDDIVFTNGDFFKSK
ncbi:MAG: hypothetical protein ACI8PB_002389 [Desulforhopalus sp.]|jgi:hypothetical protein